jgi:hypothetical protein
MNKGYSPGDVSVQARIHAEPESRPLADGELNYSR